MDLLGKFLHRRVVLLDQIPLIHQNNHALLVADHQVENVNILAFDTACRVNQQHANIGIFDGSNRTQHRVKLQIFMNFGLFTHAGRINQVKIMAVFGVTGVNRVARCSGHLGHNIPLNAG